MNLYLIWDLRSAIETELCFSGENNCCDCVTNIYYIDADFNVATSVWNDDALSIFAANGFYSIGGIIRELVDGILLPSQPCTGCSVEVSLCFGPNAEDVCCNCDITCTTPYNKYIVANNNSFDVIVYFYDENGILTSLLLSALTPYSEFCSIGAPFSDSEITVTYDSCDCVV